MLTMDLPVPKEAWAREAGLLNGISSGPGMKSIGNEPQLAGAWGPAVQKLLGFQELGNDWDGLGALGPSSELLVSAIGLAHLFNERGMPPPNCVVPGRDGSVNFEWQAPDGTVAEVEIDRPFHAEVMVILPGQAPTFWTLPTD
jgi:hypothetical protein